MLGWLPPEPTASRNDTSRQEGTLMWRIAFFCALLASLIAAIAQAGFAAAATPAPHASFEFSPGSPVTGQAVTFDATTSSCAAAPCSFSWADDPPSGGSWPLGTGQTLSFTFQHVGTKYITLTVTDAQNRTDMVEHNVVVTSPPRCLRRC